MTITVNPKNKKQLEQVKTILKAIDVDFVEEQIENDWFKELSEAEKNSIEMGLKNSTGGKVIPHSEAKKLYEK